MNQKERGGVDHTLFFFLFFLLLTQKDYSLQKYMVGIMMSSKIRVNTLHSKEQRCH